MKRRMLSVLLSAMLVIATICVSNMPSRAVEPEDEVTQEEMWYASENSETTTEELAEGTEATTEDDEKVSENIVSTETIVDENIDASETSETADTDCAVSDAAIVTASETATEVAIDETNFPDSNFRSYVKQFDTDGNGSFSSEELLAVTSISVNSKEIGSLKGVEYFTDLKYLYCMNNQLTSLDVSGNPALVILECASNELTSLDVSGNPALDWLQCSWNQLTSLDVSGAPALVSLSCYNNELTSLDVSDCTALVDLYCYNNQLISLDVSDCTALVDLYCYNNQLTSLDVSKSMALEDFRCHNNNLTSLDVSNNPALGHLVCRDNELTNLDVSKDPALRSLYCDYNNLTSLDVSNNPALSVLLCYNNELTSLNVSKSTALYTLECNNNKLTSLDVSKNTELTRLYCYENSLASLDVSKNTKLTKLNCNKNKLTSLDVSNNPALVVLSCDRNRLTSLDVSRCTALEELWCRENELTSLDVSKNTALKMLRCNYNQPTSLNVGKNTALKQLDIDSNITTDISFLDLSHLDIYVPQFKGTIDLSNITGIEKYMSGSGWNADTKKLTYEMDYDTIINTCTVGKNTRLVCYTTGRFSSYQGYSFFRDAYGNVRCYDSNGNPVINEFKCDGTYTYYFQLDGTAMKNRLTYHPDGKHVIYFDENGHEVFSNFHHVEKSIAGDAVDDLCFFDVYGHMYVDVMTYDQAGEKLYYVNPYGVIEQGKWFEFSDTCVWAGTTNKVGKGYGYANADGTLMINTHTYDWLGRYVYMQGNGHMK